MSDYYSKKSYLERKAKWEYKKNNPLKTSKATLIKRTTSNIVVRSNDSIECICCRKVVDRVNSVIARIYDRKGHTRIINPTTLNRPTTYIHPSGEIINVDTVKNVSYDIKIQGRVCLSCLLPEDEVIYEDSLVTGRANNWEFDHKVKI